MTKKQVNKDTGRIGIIGNDSSGERMGRKTEAIASALKAAGYEVFVSHTGTFRHKNLDVVIVAGKHCTAGIANTILDYCNRTETSLICTGNMAALIDEEDVSEKIQIFDVGNFKWELYKFFSFCERLGAFDRIEEVYQCQQAGKTEASGAIRGLVESRYVEVKWEQVILCDGIENMSLTSCDDEKEIPQLHYDDFEFYRVTFKSGTVKCFLDFGRESAVTTAKSMLAILNGPTAGFLDKGRIHTVGYLVGAGY